VVTRRERVLQKLHLEEIKAFVFDVFEGKDHHFLVLDLFVVGADLWWDWLFFYTCVVIIVNQAAGDLRQLTRTLP
jgi:hypothetical protein